MIFDDSHEHAAWNRSNNDRVVLFVDFSRPLPEPLFGQNQLVIEQIGRSDFIVDALSRWTAWEAEHGKAIDELMGIHPR